MESRHDPSLDRFERLTITVADESELAWLRKQVAGAALEWGRSEDDADDLRLVVVELVTNAFRYGVGRPVVTLVREGDGLVSVSVWDGSPVLPVVPPRDELGVSGRGLRMIRSLARDLGWAPLEKGGKEVWARL